MKLGWPCHSCRGRWRRVLFPEYHIYKYPPPPCHVPYSSKSHLTPSPSVRLCSWPDLVVVVVAVEEGLFPEDHARKHTAQAPHVKWVVIHLKVPLLYHKMAHILKQINGFLRKLFLSNSANHARSCTSLGSKVKNSKHWQARPSTIGRGKNWFGRCELKPLAQNGWGRMSNCSSYGQKRAEVYWLWPR